MSKWKCQRGPFRRSCLEIDESQNHVVNQPRVSTQEWRSRSEPRRESVLAPYRGDCIYTSTLSHPRATPAVRLRQNSASVLTWWLYDNMTRQTHTHQQSLTYTHLFTRSTNPVSVMHTQKAAVCFGEVCGGLSASWWKLSVRARYALQLKKYTDSFTFSRSKSPTREKLHDYGLLGSNM